MSLNVTSRSKWVGEPDYWPLAIVRKLWGIFGTTMKQLWEYFWTTTYETSFRLLQLSDNFWENINNFQPSLDNFETSEIKLNFETTLRQLWGSFGTTLRQLGDSFSGDQMVTTIVTIDAPLPCGQHFSSLKFWSKSGSCAFFCLLDENSENVPVNQIPLAADWALGVLHFWVQAQLGCCVLLGLVHTGIGIACTSHVLLCFEWRGRGWMVGSIIGNAEPHPATRRSPEEPSPLFFQLAQHICPARCSKWSEMHERPQIIKENALHVLTGAVKYRSIKHARRWISALATSFCSSFAEVVLPQPVVAAIVYLGWRGGQIMCEDGGRGQVWEV